MNNKQRPYFLWDYDLTDAQVRQILSGTNQTEKIWIMSRILESARFDDIWSYVSLEEVRKMFPILKLKKPIERAWKRALYVWN